MESVKEESELDRADARMKWRDKVNSDAAHALVKNGVSAVDAKAIVALIASGVIPRVTITY